MEKLARKTDGEVVEGSIYFDSKEKIMRVVYYDYNTNAWVSAPLDDFKPAEPGVDY